MATKRSKGKFTPTATGILEEWRMSKKRRRRRRRGKRGGKANLPSQKA